MLVLVAQSCPTLCNPMDCSSLSMRFSRQAYWSGLLFPSPGDLPNPGIEPRSPALQAFRKCLLTTLSFPGSANGKEPACQCRKYKRVGFHPWVGHFSWRRAWQPTPAGVQPRWIQGDLKVGAESVSLEITYLITDREGLEN